MFKRLKAEISLGRTYANNDFHNNAAQTNQTEISKTPLRSDVINFIIDTLSREVVYLEIGVRNPSLNFDLIKAPKKYSVDPGLEYKANPVDFKVTSDNFFKGLQNGTYLNPDIKFDIIFIDGLHLAEQVDRDIENSLNYLKEDGFIVLHDCNPPTEWNAREEHQYRLSPAGNNWNGTTWKAFFKWRKAFKNNSICIDTDWGVGIISKKKEFKQTTFPENPFYEYKVFDQSRKAALNLVSFDDFKKLF